MAGGMLAELRRRFPCEFALHAILLFLVLKIDRHKVRTLYLRNLLPCRMEFNDEHMSHVYGNEAQCGGYGTKLRHGAC